MKKELVSVVVPVYNVEKYIRECVDSLLNQTYKEIEIILVDDGSTDNSLDICIEYAKKDSRVRIFHKDNEGLGLTRNYGIHCAKGSYICFLDSDDYLFSDAIEAMVVKSQETGAQIVSANMIYRDVPMTVPINEGLYSKEQIKNVFMIGIMGNYPGKHDGISYTSTAKLYRLDLIRANDIKFPSERILIWEDLVFTTRILSLCDSLYVMKKNVYYYRFNASSLTHCYKPNKFELVIEMYNYMLEQIKSFNLDSESELRLSNNFLGHIRTCLKLEVFYSKINGFRYSLSRVKVICDALQTKKIINKIPKSTYNLSQYLYSQCIQNKMYLLVYILTWLQNKRNRID